MASGRTASGDSLRAAQTLVDASVALLDTAARARLLDFIERRRTADGLFRGRAGGGDLYYSVFGLGLMRALAPDACAAAARACAASVAPADSVSMDLVHAAALARIKALGGISADGEPLHRVEAFRTPDGGYHVDGPRASRAQIHASHLAMLAYDAAATAWPAAPFAGGFVSGCLASRGGYGNEPGAGDGTVPATAAALAMLAHEGLYDAPAVAWLAAQRDSASGGFRAGPEASTPDLLSTAAALFALRRRDALPTDVAQSGVRFMERCWNADGGFGSHPGDSLSDVEYSWYALLALGAALAP
jgi:prenyltransferase beta subunit